MNTAINIFAHKERSIGFSEKRMKRFVKGKCQAPMRSWTANPIAEIEGLFAEYLSIYSLRSLFIVKGAICFKTCAKSKSVSSTILSCPFAGLGSKLPDWQNEVQIFFIASPVIWNGPSYRSVTSWEIISGKSSPADRTESSTFPDWLALCNRSANVFHFCLCLY